MQPPEDLRRGDHQAAHGFAALAFRHLLGVLEIGYDAAAALEESQPRVGEADRAGSPVQEPNAQPLLKRRHVTGDRRGRQSQFPGGRRKAVQFRNGDEGPDGGKAIHIIIPYFATVYG